MPMDNETKIELLRQFALNNPGIYEFLKVVCSASEKKRKEKIDEVSGSRNRGRASSDFSKAVDVLKEEEFLNEFKEFLDNNEPYDD